MNRNNILTKIFIKDLVVSCIIGASKLERQEKQPVLINVTLWTDAGKAGETDDLAETVNYKDIYLEIIKLVEHGSFQLLEKLAEEIAKICLGQLRVEKVEVRVEKPKALKFAASAGVEIIRTR
jgi:dihydroneopterin aldolase/D-erythro-7,8-dihydroneopterin triphosphate epimerase